MTGDVTPVLWLFGPPGVGKTTVGWEIYSALVRSGTRAGYVDIDQLGMCFPESASDPGRFRLQARNLAAVIAGHRAAGARCVVVTGCLDAGHGAHVDELPRVALTLCRLRADHEELAQRLVGRRGQSEDVELALRDAAAQDAATVTAICVDTSGLTVDEVTRRVRERTGWPVLTDPGRSPAAVAGSQPRSGPAVPDHRAAVGPADASAEGAACDVDRAGPVLWICGATGVGKSTVGFQVFLKTMQAGVKAAYLDLDQLRFCGPVEADGAVTAHTVAAVWRHFRATGARALVMVGPVEDSSVARSYVDALPAGTVTMCRLHGGRDELTKRIMLRGRGAGSWTQPGDPLVGQPAAHLLRVADRAARDADALERAAIGHRVDTDGRAPDEIAGAVMDETGWLSRIT